jgi:NAD+ diphosphatase
MAQFSPLTFLPDGHAGPTRCYFVKGSKVLISDRSQGAGPAHFLGLLDATACWAVEVTDADDDDGFVDLYSLFGRTDEVDWIVAGRAVQIIDWARSHRFCGRCGTATTHNDNDRAMRCPACGLLAFPRLAPAIITLVTRGDEALLARGVNFRGPTYSCLAGFVEPGESLEQAVVREVGEEVGVRVGSVRYWGSQPWPFPHSLMLGFHAQWEDGEIVVDPREIVDANWYTRDRLPSIPPGISIARRLIDDWVRQG